MAATSPLTTSEILWLRRASRADGEKEMPPAVAARLVVGCLVVRDERQHLKITRRGELALSRLA